jgi:hypothetical protein
MISAAQRRFAPMVIGIDWNPDRHQIGISDRHRWNTQAMLSGQRERTTSLCTQQSLQSKPKAFTALLRQTSAWLAMAGVWMKPSTT